MTWRKHVEATAAKASRTLGFLRRNLRECSKPVREAAYTSMVRPTLEYASSAWDPYTTEDINRLDKVQRRAARFVANNSTDRTPGCVTAMVNSLGWETLTQRRLHHRLIMMYKTIHGDVDTPEAASIVKTGDKRTRGAHRLHLPLTSSKFTSFPSTPGPSTTGTYYQQPSQTSLSLRTSRPPYTPWRPFPSQSCSQPTGVHSFIFNCK